MLENLYVQGILSKEQFDEMIAPLRRRLSEIAAGKIENQVS